MRGSVRIQRAFRLLRRAERDGKLSDKVLRQLLREPSDTEVADHPAAARDGGTPMFGHISPTEALKEGEYVTAAIRSIAGMLLRTGKARDERWQLRDSSTLFTDPLVRLAMEGLEDRVRYHGGEGHARMEVDTMNGVHQLLSVVEKGVTAQALPYSGRDASSGWLKTDFVNLMKQMGDAVNTRVPRPEVGASEAKGHQDNNADGSCGGAGGSSGAAQACKSPAKQGGDVCDAPSRVYGHPAIGIRFAGGVFDVYAMQKRFNHCNVVWRVDSINVAGEGTTMLSCVENALNMVGTMLVLRRWLLADLQHGDAAVAGEDAAARELRTVGGGAGAGAAVDFGAGEGEEHGGGVGAARRAPARKAVTRAPYRDPLLCCSLVAGLVALAVGASASYRGDSVAVSLVYFAATVAFFVSCLSIGRSSVAGGSEISHTSPSDVNDEIDGGGDGHGHGHGSDGEEDADVAQRFWSYRRRVGVPEDTWQSSAGADTRRRRVRFSAEELAIVEQQARCFADPSAPTAQPRGRDRFIDYGLLRSTVPSRKLEPVVYKMFRSGHTAVECAHEVSVLSTLAKQGVPHIEPPIMAFAPRSTLNSYLGNSWFGLLAVAVFRRLRPVMDANDQVVAPRDVHELRRHARHLLEALEGVHRAGYVHRDVSLGNVMLRDTGDGKTELVLIDFGQAVYLEAAFAVRDPRMSGTEGFVAPELERDGCLSTAADVFSAGCVVEHLLGGLNYAGAPRVGSDSAALHHDSPGKMPRTARGPEDSPESSVATSVTVSSPDCGSVIVSPAMVEYDSGGAGAGARDNSSPRVLDTTSSAPSYEGRECHATSHVATAGVADAALPTPRLADRDATGQECVAQQPIQSIGPVMMDLARKFVQELLIVDPERRPTAAEALLLPFLSSRLCPCCDAETPTASAALPS